MTHSSDASQVDPIEEQQTSLAPTFWEIVWRHKLLLGLGLAVGLVLGALYRAQIVPEYMSSTKVLVVKKRPDALPLPGAVDPRVAFMDDYLATHQVLIKSPLIVGEAVKKRSLQTLRSFAGTDPAGEIIGALGVIRETTEGGAANILNINYRSRVAEDCAPVLDAIIESYKDFLDVTYRNVSEDTFKLITQAKDLLDKEFTRKQDEYRAFRRKNPGLTKGKNGITIGQDLLFNLETSRTALVIRQVEVEERLEAFENAMKTAQSRDTLMAMIADAKQTSDGGKLASSTAEDSLMTLLLQEQTLSEDFGPNHPQVRSVRKRIEYVRSKANAIESPLDPVQAHLASLKRELETIKTKKTNLDKRLQGEKAEAQKLIAYEDQDDSFRQDIARHKQLFDSIVKRLDEISLVKDVGGYDLKRISPATAASRVGVKIVPILVVSGLLGLFCGLGLAFLTEIADKSFRTPEDVRRRLGLPIMGQIPDISKKEVEAAKPGEAEIPGIAPIMCTHHFPKSREAEAYRGVRTGLFFSTQGKGHKVIQITSPSMGDGKSTLAANLAISIAQAEKKVILIDADFRRPTIHQLFGVSSTRGLGSVLTGETEPADVILPSGVQGLSILPAGPLPPNPAELLSLPRFKELLDYIREQYDFVIIDTPPLLAVTDPCMVVPYMDGVLLTFRISKQNRPNALRAKEILATLGARVLGVVVNAVNQRGKGYGYGYGYGYGEGYGYGGDYYHKATEAKSLDPEPAKKNES